MSVTIDATTNTIEASHEDWQLGCKTIGYVLGTCVWIVGVSTWLACSSILLGLLAYAIALIAAVLFIIQVDTGWQADKVETLGRVTGCAINKVRGFFKR